MTSPAIHAIRGGLVVSCQSYPGEPLDKVEHIVALAESALLGGALGLRLDGAPNIRAVRDLTSAPIIGIKKVAGPGRPQITPTIEDGKQVIAAGADIVAVDASTEFRSDSELREIIERLKLDGAGAVMADISTFDEAERAWTAGADVIGTTLYGHTPQTRSARGPALALAADLADAGMRVVLEGHISGPEDVRAAYGVGVWSVVVGSAITNPIKLTARYVAATPHSARDVENGATAKEHDSAV